MGAQRGYLAQSKRIREEFLGKRTLRSTALLGINQVKDGEKAV